MPNYFWDTSALVKRYFQEMGSDGVRLMLEAANNQHFMVRLTIAEVTSAIVRQTGSAVSNRLLSQFNEDMSNNFHLRQLDDALVDSAIALVRQHRLRGCDSLQLAAALHLADELSEIAAELDLDEEPAALTFICADDLLNGAAAEQGLAVINPAVL